MEAATVPQQPVPPEQVPPEAVLAAVTVALMADLPQPELAAYLERLLAPLGLAPEAARAAVMLTGGLGTVSVALLTRKPGPATAHLVRTFPPRRAAYLLAAARRLDAGGALEAERRYFGQHKQAERTRVESAVKVDRAVGRWGPVLGWYARMDEATTSACRAANGQNFQAHRPPTLPGVEEGHQITGFPGTPHGGACRCLAGPPWPEPATMLA